MIHLIKRKKILLDGKTAIYWMLQYPGIGTTPSGKPKIVTESLGRVTKGEAEELRRVKEAEYSTGTARPGGRITLARFREEYLERRAQDGGSSGRHKAFPKLSRSTLSAHDMFLRYLLAHCGEHRLMSYIDEAEAERFLAALERGSLSSARRLGVNRPISEQSVRKHIRTGQAVWRWAIHNRKATSNPFLAFHSRPLETEPGTYVSMEVLEKLLAVSDPGHRCMFGLCRLAGLRREEARTLPWSGREQDHLGRMREIGVDWKGRKLMVVSAKNAHYREVPIVKPLYDILLSAFTEAEPGVRSITGLFHGNLWHQSRAIAKAAGLNPWPKFYQAMRVSRENDWKEAKFAEATYTAWMGHSPTVSRMHYVSPTPAEHARAID